MAEIKNLYETINIEKEAIRRYKPDILIIPKYISENLKYEFYDWQKKAFENLLIYEADHKKQPTHLMFNMATGSGKTLLMAATMLYYFKQGYKHFVFFVHRNTIVDKTENNFIDSTHTKYLYKEKIEINDKTVSINKVETFSDNPEGIEIKFTTIQKLYSDIHLERENQTTLDDIIKKDIVMLADEAHHLNANTKNIPTQSELFETELKGTKNEIEKKGWEHTVIKLILNKSNQKKNNKNVLLEFTATMPANENVEIKYSDKRIYKFELKEFLSAGYTKEINLISSTLNKKERVLQALLFNWYRHKIALKNSIANFKPVILFRSKTIEKSKADYEEFINWASNIKRSDFNYLKKIENKITQSNSLYEQGKSRTRDVLEFIKNDNIKVSEITNFIKYYFQDKFCIITNSKDKKAKGKNGGEKTTEAQDKLLNNLEDKNNHIRAIFTVDRLTEGWDVLNLFDIVRLYQEQTYGGSTKNTSEATTKEKQLIGRGVRYFPFTYKDKQKNKRKFDEDLKNELRVLEELYYYTYDEESRYISHLKNELRKDGYIDDGKIIKEFCLKEEFKACDFYKNVKIWLNDWKKNPKRKKKTLKDIKSDPFITYQIRGLELKEQEVEFNKKDDIERLNISEKNSHIIFGKLNEFEKHIFNKAINIKAKSYNSLFQFEKLKDELEIKSIEDLLKSNFLGDFGIEIIAPKNIKALVDIENKEKLNILLKFLEKFLIEFKGIINPKVGTEFTRRKTFAEIFGETKEKSIKEEKLNKEIPTNKWYVLDSFVGTSEEEKLIEFIQNTIGNLKTKYNEIYLLRNEEVYKIYDFEKGRGFQPDFILFLKGQTALYYQVFIEPKGDNLLKAENWKDVFLKEISERYGTKNILKNENEKYILIGLPLLNINNEEQNEKPFEKAFFEELELYQSKKYVDTLPVYSIQAAAGKFGKSEPVKEEDLLEIKDYKLSKDMFITKIKGNSMRNVIKDGEYGVFKKMDVFPGTGEVVLVQHRDIDDTETGGSYSIKRYYKRKKYLEFKADTDQRHIAKNTTYKIKENQIDSIKIIAEYIGKYDPDSKKIVK